jgi:hypothetical protein
MVMPIRPIPPLYRHRRHRQAGASQPFILRSDLDATILRMISTHSMAAFTPAIDRTAPAQKPRDAAAAASAAPSAAGATTVSAPVAQRTLGAVPAMPARPAPRGSLIDLRV